MDVLLSMRGPARHQEMVSLQRWLMRKEGELRRSGMKLVVDLGRCPAGRDMTYPQQAEQPNPLLENVEGMALGDQRLTDGEHKGRLPLYLVSDNNESADQRTRVYALSVRLPQ